MVQDASPRGDDVPPVWRTPQEPQQVFLNLVLNALHALGESGTIRIVTGKQGKFVLGARPRHAILGATARSR